MRFKITLVPRSANPVVPINYQYPLSAVIYKVLAEADSEYATFLHEKGYQVGEGLKRFKLFTFSDLQMKFKLRGDRMHISSDPQLIISFHLPEAAQNFIKGIFINRELDIADKKSKATFLVGQVQALPMPTLQKEGVVSQIFTPFSMVVCGEKDEKGNYRFLSPEEDNWGDLMTYNWKEKCKAVQMQLSEKEWESMRIQPQTLKRKPKSRLVTIKAGTPAQTRIKGYYNFGIMAMGTLNALKLLINAGCGVYNSLGCGCLGVDNKSDKYR